MRALVDTHILLWTLTNDPKLSAKAKEIVEDAQNELFYSIASMWEVEIKHLRHPDRMKMNGSKLADGCERLGIQPLVIAGSHVKMLESLKRPEDAPAHNDPFDKLMLAQAKAEELTFVTHDSMVPYYHELCVISV